MAKQKKLSFDSEKFIRSLFKLIGSVFLVGGIFIFFIAIGVISSTMIEALNFSPKDFQIGKASSIYYYDSTGNPELYQPVNSESNLQWVSFDDIPQYMKDAAVAIEDERFYSHNGVDIKRTFAAIFVNVTGRDTFGGSTITQQVVKNITKDDDRDALRKVREIFRAIKFEQEYSKDEILEFYLNIAYFGAGDGVQSAAYAYFGKDVSELNLAECASIVGITKYPAKYNPLKNPEENKKRQETVLGKMLELEMISQTEYDEAIAYELDFTGGKRFQANSDSKQSYFTELVISEVIHDLVHEAGYTESVAKSMIYNGGLTIYSTVDPDVQYAMETVLENRANFTTSPTVQAAMVVIDPQTGEIKGCVGGAGIKNHDLGLNRAVDTFRQTGSTTKPLTVYGPAMDEGIIAGPGDIIEDKPININGYKPKNWYGGYKGKTTIREAIVQSMNTPAVQVVDKMGVNVSLSYLKNSYHISSITDKDSLAAASLGGQVNGVNVLEWTAAYGTIANDGEWISPKSYSMVTDHSGNIILRKKQKTEFVFSKETNFMITDILRTTATRMGGAVTNATCAGKTGTTNNNVDKWYMGFTPYYVGGVWVGNDDSTPMNDGATYNAPQKIWKAVMSEIHRDKPVIGFSAAPSRVKRVNICIHTGKIAKADYCETISEYVNTNVAKYCDGEHPLSEEEEETPPEGEDEASETPSDSPSDTDETDTAGETSNSDETNTPDNSEDSEEEKDYETVKPPWV